MKTKMSSCIQSRNLEKSFLPSWAPLTSKLCSLAGSQRSLQPRCAEHRLTHSGGTERLTPGLPLCSFHRFFMRWRWKSRGSILCSASAQKIAVLSGCWEQQGEWGPFPLTQLPPPLLWPPQHSVSGIINVFSMKIAWIWSVVCNQVCKYVKTFACMGTKTYNK